MSPQSEEPETIKAFRRWARDNGGYIHDALCFQSEPTRTVIASRAIPSGTCVLSCPFDLAITKDLAMGAVKALVWDATHADELDEPSPIPERIDRLNERQIICAYLALHWICTGDDAKIHLKHRPYIDSLPPPTELVTPLHFTPAELALLNGTNLLGATLDRRKEWENEWREVRDIFADAIISWGEGLTWTRWLTAATYLSSRAFPSNLLSPNPSKTMSSSAASYPVLLPILDCLNHARGHPVSWVVTSSPPRPPPSADAPPASPPSDGATPTLSNINANALHITLHLRTSTPTQAEVFNNYGPKPNSELLLGYGFVLPSNPEDTIVLKLGGSDQRHEIGRHAGRAVTPSSPSTPSGMTDSFPLSGSPPSSHTVHSHHAHVPAPAVGTNGMRSLWDEVEKMVLTSGEDDESVTSMEGGWEVALEVCEALDEMISQKIDALPDLSEIPDLPSAGIRAEVRSMIAEYVKGQKEVLEGILEYVEMRKRDALEGARASGLDVQEVSDLDDADTQSLP